MKYTLPLDKIDRDDGPIVGRKGAHLGEVVRAGFPVPKGFVIGAGAYFDFLQSTGLKEKIHQLLQDLNEDDVSKIGEASSLIEKALARSSLPEQLEKEVVGAYSKLSRGKKVYVAVRSSVAGDLLSGGGAERSSYLNVSGAGE